MPNRKRHKSAKQARKLEKEMKKVEIAEEKVLRSLKKEKTRERSQSAHHTHRQARLRETNIKKPYYSKGFLHQPKNVKPVLTAWDKMTIAKERPGQFNVSYVAGMNIAPMPTMTFKVSNCFEKASLMGTSSMVPIGSESYTLLMWCPSMTNFRGLGGGGQIQPSDKLGGLIIKVVKKEDENHRFIDRNIFQDALSSLTMMEVYGSDMTGFSEGGFIWASEITMNMTVAAASLVGAIYRGTILYGQLSPQGIGQALSIKDLIEIMGDTTIMKPSFHMRAGVANNNIVYEGQQFLSERLIDNEFNNELVNIVILQDCARSIQGNELINYGLQARIRGNGVFFATPGDSLANNIMKNNSSMESPLPGFLAGVEQNPDRRPPKAEKDLEEVANFMKAGHGPEKRMLAPTNGLSSPLLSMMNPPKEESTLTNFVVTANYLKDIERAMLSLAQLSLQNKFLDLTSITQELQTEYEKVNQSKDRLYIIGPDELEAIEIIQEKEKSPETRSISNTRQSTKY